MVVTVSSISSSRSREGFRRPSDREDIVYQDRGQLGFLGYGVQRPLTGRSTLIELFVSLAAIGGLLLLLGLFAGLVHESGFLSEPLFALLAGVLVGPGVFDLLDLSDLGDQVVLLKDAALVTLAVALMGVALRLPIGYITSNWQILIVLLGILMPLMWFACSLLTYLILGVSFWVALLIGGILTPTDPVVASTIVTGGVASGTYPHGLGTQSLLSLASTTDSRFLSCCCRFWC
jgi:NhaP-type Na+/H+ or K+/H+ antiporter